MSVKLIAMGNILMKDDAIGIEVAKKLEDKLIKKGIEVVYAETDFQYCFSKILENDFVFILDAAYLGKKTGAVTFIPLENYSSDNMKPSQHDYNFLNLLRLYYNNVQGIIIAIEVNDVGFSYGLSCELKKKLNFISNYIFNYIENVLSEKCLASSLGGLNEYRI